MQIIGVMDVDSVSLSIEHCFLIRVKRLEIMEQAWVIRTMQS